LKSRVIPIVSSIRKSEALELTLTWWTTIDQQAVGTILDLAEKYGRHTRDISQQGAGSTKEIRGDERIRKMEANLKVSDQETSTDGEANILARLSLNDLQTARPWMISSIPSTRSTAMQIGTRNSEAGSRT
jgi:hypothetical protein